MATSFLKTQGAGNDFIVFDLRGEDPGVDWHGLAPRLCDRHFGIGADGLLLIVPPSAPGTAHARMRVINADGSEPEMCGNGLRCFVRVLYDQGEVPGHRLDVETGAGVLQAEVLDHPTGVQVRLDMGKPAYQGKTSLTLPDRTLEVALVSMGNPHCVAFVDDLAALPFERLGPLVERHPRFPDRVNAEFVQVISPDRLRVKVWERGSGPTLACGTGACAVAVAAREQGLAGSEVTVELPGGELAVAWTEAGTLTLTGPAERVFEGRVNLAAWQGERACLPSA